jgi:hypothetical protein
MAETLPNLIDCAGIARELGVKRNVAERIMRQLPKVVVPGVRKQYVRRDNVLELLNKNTEAA